jgi:tetratricopeptide (TPR) repeat protein
MRLLWAARQGLAESELMDLLGESGEPLPRAYWSPLFLAAEQGLVSRGGLLCFSHDYLRQAVRSRYLSRKAGRQEAHLRLADYFAGREINQRRIDEQPWQLAESGDWNRLFYLLADLSFFDAAWNQSHSEVKSYWTRIEEHSNLRVTDAFEPLLDRLANWRTPYVPFGWQPTLQMGQLAPGPPPNENHVWRVSELLSDLGHTKEAMRIREWLKERFEATGDRSSLSVALGGQAAILKARGELDEALGLFKQQEEISRGTGNKESLIGALIGRAQILESKGSLDESIELCAEAERIAVEAGNRLALMAALGNRASVVYLRGQTDLALDLYKQEEKIARELDNKEGLFVALSNQGLVLNELGQAEEALALFKRGERIAAEMGDRKGIAASLGHQAKILSGRGQHDGALSLLEKKERICRELGDQEGLASMFQLRGEIARETGDRSLAMQCYREEERIARQFDYQFALYNSLTAQARVHQEGGRLDQAAHLLGEAEATCRQSPIQLSSVLRQQALVLKEQRDFEQALVKLAEAERVSEEAGNQHELVTVLSNVAAVHLDRNDFPRALEVLRREEPLASSLNDQRNMQICRVGIPTCLAILADNFADNGRVIEARQYYTELEARARELGDGEYLSRSLDGQADLFIRSGDPDGALKKLEEIERRSRAAADRRRLASCLMKQAAILVESRREMDKARAKAEEAATIFEELNMTLDAAQAEAVILRIRSGLGGRGAKLAGLFFVLLLAAGGVALGLWKPWLWIIGGPLLLFAAMNLILTLSPSLQRRYNDYVRRQLAARGGPQR